MAPPSQQPAVKAKGISQVQLLRTRSQLARLDVWPFFVLYSLLFVKCIFHASKFQWNDLTTTSYLIGVAALLHVLAFLATHWSTRLAAAVSSSTTTRLADTHRVLVVPEKFNGSMEIVKLERRTLREGLKSMEELGFEFRKQRFVYNAEVHCFEKLAFPVKETLEFYAKVSGHGTEAKMLAVYDKYGLNKFDVPLPPFGALLKEHLVAPFFCFQVFCVFLWMMDQYWYYSLFTLFMLVSFECTLVSQRLRNLRELRSLQTPKQHIQVYRCGKWELLPGDALFPGDVISIGRPTGGAGAEEQVVPADCLLVAGSCIAEEAVLTGESTPQWKLSIADLDPALRLNIKQDKNHVLFGGTKILQHTGEKNARIRTPDGGCLAVVLRTGFETAQGRLMRTILFSTERVTANSLEAGIFICFLLIFALAAAWHVLSHGLQDPNRDRFKLVLNCIMIITSVIPPELPMELSMAVNASLVALAKKRVFCTEPFRIPFAGKVEVCCFDKTGTLTSDRLILEDVVVSDAALALPTSFPCAATVAASPSSSRAAAATASLSSSSATGGAGGGYGAEVVSAELQVRKALAHRIMATCHSLVTLAAQGGGDPEIVGDPLEKAALEAVEWSYASDVCKSPDKATICTIVTRHHFSSNLKRMSCVVRCSSTYKTRLEVVTKGAPEVIKQLLAEVPLGYDAMYKRYAAQGARVIALAVRQLGDEQDVDMVALRTRPREELESQLTWAGFAVFSCPLKEESEPALGALRASSHQLVMITGDAPLTACFAASKVHIITRDVVVLSHVAEEKGQAVHGPSKGKVAQQDADEDYVWISPDETVQIPFSRAWEHMLDVASRYDLAVSGDALAFCERLGVVAHLIPLVQVFARVSPEQKELVVVTLRAKGSVTLMCGDGTNDVGGLKAAHVGVALLSASESAAKAKKAKKNKESKDGKEGAKEAGRQLQAVPPQPSGTVVATPGGTIVPQATLGTAAVPNPNKTKSPGQAMLDKVRAAGKPVTPQMVKMAEWMDRMEAEGAGEPPLLKPGDASMASPFTAKASSVMPCTDIIKQGRSTLVTTIQMFKILGLLCLSTAYGLSVMYLQGVKMSDVQATLNGVLTAALFFFISQAKPLETLSPVRPHPSIFSPYFFISLLGQFGTHLALLAYMYHLSLEAMPPEQRLGADAEFKPNLVNSVTYMVEAIIQLSTFTVNYMGHPFNNAITENPKMFNVLKYMALFLVVVLFDIVPGLNEWFGMVPIPDHIRIQLLVLGCGMFGFNYMLENVMREVFPAHIPPEKGYLEHVKKLARTPPRLAPASCHAKTE